MPTACADSPVPGLAAAQVACLLPAHAGPAVEAGRGGPEVLSDGREGPAINRCGDWRQITGSPCWDGDGGLLRIPVLLAPGTRYRLSFNEGAEGGFRGANGEVLAPREWVFDVS